MDQVLLLTDKVMDLFGVNRDINEIIWSLFGSSNASCLVLDRVDGDPTRRQDLNTNKVSKCYSIMFYLSQLTEMHRQVGLVGQVDNRLLIVVFVIVLKTRGRLAHVQ